MHESTALAEASQTSAINQSISIFADLALITISLHSCTEGLLWVANLSGKIISITANGANLSGGITVQAT